MSRNHELGVLEWDGPGMSEETAKGGLDLVVRSGNVFTEDGLRKVDVGVRDGQIVALEENLTGSGEVIDASGKLILPGGIDPHTHMGIPIKDTWSADDFTSGSIAAAFGGTTTILDFTVQHPGQTLQESLQERIGKASGKSHVDFGLHINITDRPQDRLDEIAPLVERGFNSFKAFTTYKEMGMMMPWPVFDNVLERISACNGLLMLHCEDDGLVSRLTRSHSDQGHQAPIYHPRSRTAEAEALAITKATSIARDLGASLYIVHVSSRLGLEAGLRARDQGLRVYLETCPQYLVLDERRYLGENGHYWITTPPLRSRSDIDALWKGIEKGDIDTIGTDHCPFTIDQKNRYGGSFDRTPNGIPGVENRLALLYTYGVVEGRISLERMVDLLSANVSRVFGLDDRKGSIALGKDADLVGWESGPTSVITADAMHGRADFTPYEGLRQVGRVDFTLLRGRTLVRGDEFVGRKVWGDLVTAQT